MSGSLDRKRLLIVDDDRLLRDVLTTVLGRAGYEVEAAEDGIQALELAASFAPDLILLDLMMPKVDGREVLRRLRDEGRGAIPVVIVSAYADEAQERELRREPNVVDFLRKPVAYADLPVVVERLLSR